MIRPQNSESTKQYGRSEPSGHLVWFGRARKLLPHLITPISAKGLREVMHGEHGWTKDRTTNVLAWGDNHKIWGHTSQGWRAKVSASFMIDSLEAEVRLERAKTPINRLKPSKTPKIPKKRVKPVKPKKAKKAKKQPKPPVSMKLGDLPLPKHGLKQCRACNHVYRPIRGKRDNGFCSAMCTRAHRRAALAR